MPNQILHHLYQYPKLLLTLLALLLGLAILGFPRFSFDASADTLVVEGDPALAYYREISQRFGGDEFLILTFRPQAAADQEPWQALFARPALDQIAALEDALLQVPGVASVFSLLDAPLLDYPGQSLADLVDEIRTLRSPDADLAAAYAELTSSPVFADLLVSRDGATTALRIDLAPDPKLEALYDRRSELRALAAPSAAEKAERRQVERAYHDYRYTYLANRDAMLKQVRDIRSQHANGAELYLGGVPMIAADMIAYVRSDVVVFGAGVGLMVLLMLWLFFRQVRWVLLPVATSGVSIALVVGGLGWLEQPVTVVSSNFIALLAIITISFTIHLIVRYRELGKLHPEAGHARWVVEAMHSKFAPCLYTALTTMVAFGSLVSSGIVPVMDFGWMMFVGVAIAFVVTYSLFPALLVLLFVQAALDVRDLLA